MKVLVRFKDTPLINHFQQKATFVEILKWLNDNIGKQGSDWEWLRGDLLAQGVYLPTEHDAVVFKLRFGL